MDPDPLDETSLTPPAPKLSRSVLLARSVLVAVAVLGVSGLAAWALILSKPASRLKDDLPVAPTVNTGTIARETVRPYLHAYGEAAALDRYELAFDRENGRIEIEGRGTAVLEKRDGSWLIVHLHTSGRRKR